jgi:hypothetical protein
VKNYFKYVISLGYAQAPAYDYWISKFITLA